MRRASSSALAGLCADPVPLLALLADATKDDATRQRLCLGGRCLPELSVEAHEACRKARQSHGRRGVLKTSAKRRALPNIGREILELWWTNDESETHFSHVTNILPAIGALSASELMPDLLERSRADNANIRTRAAKALGQLGPAAATDAVLSRLTECLHDSERRVRSRAAYALGQIGPAAATEPVLSRLTDCLRDSDENVRYRAAEALGSLLRAGVRWFPKRGGRLRISTVAELSGEAETLKR